MKTLVIDCSLPIDHPNHERERDLTPAEIEQRRADSASAERLDHANVDRRRQRAADLEAIAALPNGDALLRLLGQ